MRQTTQGLIGGKDINSFGDSMTELLLLSDSYQNAWNRIHRGERRISSKKWAKNHPDIVRQNMYKYNGTKPMSINTSCSSYLGIHIAERFLSKVFESVTRMPNGTPGYDFICKKGYKIDVKSSCLIKRTDVHRYTNREWAFHINKNEVAEYFLFLAFDNRENLNPQHIWLIPGNIINYSIKLTITNTPNTLAKWKAYEQTDKLEKLVECCSSSKKGENT